ncbi:hypothetical protein [Heyndrickxia oleronia]|uniref:hypothetical protein n=1 Tax=Heyndrickxia oleronia TaxID=38875 RepID=UPI0024699F41|nr:hypothetical protein [Heyndrickxia oleronia]
MAWIARVINVRLLRLSKTGKSSVKTWSYMAVRRALPSRNKVNEASWRLDESLAECRLLGA